MNSDEEVVLRPGDNLCVEFYVITEEQKQTLSQVENHCSVQHLRKSDTITLYRCLEAFGERLLFLNFVYLIYLKPICLFLV